MIRWILLLNLIVFTIHISVAQQLGKALFLEGISDYVEIKNDSLLQNATELTLEAVINPCDVSGRHSILNKYSCFEGGFYFGINNGRLEYSWNTGNGCDWDTLMTTVLLNPKSVAQVGVVHTADSVKFFVNGVKVSASLTKRLFPVTSKESMLIGATMDTVAHAMANYFQGTIDEVRIWNKAVSDANIRRNYLLPLTGNEPGLQGYFPMEEAGAGGNFSVINRARGLLNGIATGTSYSPRNISSAGDGCLKDSRIAVFLPGNKSYISVDQNDSFEQSSALTIETWVNVCEVNKVTVLFAKGWCSGGRGMINIAVDSGKVRFVWDDDDNCISANSYQTINKVVSNNEPVHLAISHTSTKVAIYINGVEVTGRILDGKYSSIYFNNDLPLLLGCYRGQNGLLNNFLTGAMSEFRIWKRELPMNEIKLRKDIPLSGNEPGLLLYLPLNEIFAGPGKTLNNLAALTRIEVSGISAGPEVADPYSGNFAESLCPLKNQIINEFKQVADKNCDDGPFEVNATSTSGLPVTFLVSGPATLEGKNIIRLTRDSGTVAISAIQPGTSEFAPVKKTVSFKVSAKNCTIEKNNQLINIEDISPKKCNDPPFEIIAISSAELVVKYELISGPATLTGSMVTLKNKGGVIVVRAFQKGNDFYNPAADTISVIVDGEPCVEIPPVIIYELVTPEKDGKNDFFLIENIDRYSKSNLSVYNKWGNVVYSTQNYKNDWNGGSLPEGVYYYVLKLEEEKTYSGTVLISYK